MAGNNNVSPLFSHDSPLHLVGQETCTTVAEQQRWDGKAKQIAEYVL